MIQASFSPSSNVLETCLPYVLLKEKWNNWNVEESRNKIELQTVHLTKDVFFFYNYCIYCIVSKYKRARWNSWVTTEHCTALISQFVSTVSVLLCARTSLSVTLLSKQRNILKPALSFSFPGKCALAFTSAYDNTANKSMWVAWNVSAVWCVGKFDYLTGGFIRTRNSQVEELNRWWWGLGFVGQRGWRVRVRGGVLILTEATRYEGSP